MRGFLITIPPELDEAARIDGCNMVQTVTKVILPVAKQVSQLHLYLHSCFHIMNIYLH